MKVPIVSIPFSKIAIDLIGPIDPPSQRGHRWVLVIIDYATRYPEAIPLRNIDTESISEALLSVFSRVGIPSCVVSDQRTKFVSKVMQEVSRLLSIKWIKSSPYHPQANGLVEKCNATLKSMLRKICEEKPKDWDRYIEPLLFAYREAPQHSLMFSPFELLYGRTVRGPMTILKELWSNEKNNVETQSVYEYVINLRNELEKTCKLASENLVNAQNKQKSHFDVRAKQRTLEPDDLVLLLLPTDNNKLLMHWKGPFRVLERIGINDYRIQIADNTKIFHINMLKKLNKRAQADIAATVAVLDHMSDDDDDDLESVEMPHLTDSEHW